jgi:hypothetical protein
VYVLSWDGQTLDIYGSKNKNNTLYIDRLLQDPAANVLEYAVSGSYLYLLMQNGFLVHANAGKNNTRLQQ